MDKLKQSFEELKFSNVKTILNSGNVVFEGLDYSTSEIEDKLEGTFGFHIDVMVRTMKQIQDLIQTNPFKKTEMTPQTRLYVTFYSQILDHELKVPYQSSDGNFKILSVRDGAICSMITLSPNSGTLNLMSFIEKEFGKKVTTRNWNTILKVAKLAS